MSQSGEKRILPLGVVPLVTALYALGYLAWERAGWGSQDLRDLMSNVAFMPINLLVATLYLLAARNRDLDAGVRRGLRIFGVGCLMVLVGNSISVYYLLALGDNPPVSWADAFYLSDSFLMVAALLSFPIARRTRLERFKFMLDAAIVVIGGIVAIWYFTIRPAQAIMDDGIASTILSFAYPLASLLVLFGATTVLLKGQLDGNRRAFRLLVFGILVSIVADLTFDLVLVEAGERSAAWTDAVYLVAYVMLVASAELYYRRPVPASPRRAEKRTRPQQLSPLPSLAIATTYGLLLAATTAPWHDPAGAIAGGAVLMTVLVLIRQVIAVRQNVRLLAEAAAEARFRSLVQNSSDVILVVRANGMIRFASPSVARVLRRDPVSLLGRSLTELLEPEEGMRAREFLANAAVNHAPE